MRTFYIIVDFESFSKVLNRPGGFRDPGEPEEYCRGFQVFDKDMTGFIGVGQLRYSQSLVHPKALEHSSSLICRLLRASALFYFGINCLPSSNRFLSVVLTNLGEKMSDEEVDELLKAVDTSSGEINYTGNPRSGSCCQHYPSRVSMAVVNSTLTTLFPAK